MQNPEYRKLMEYALRALARRAHTSSEMREKLLSRSQRKHAARKWQNESKKIQGAGGDKLFTDSQKPHHLSGVEDLVLSRLIELKLIDDEAFVKRQIENAQNYKHEGYLKTAFRLKQKGISMAETKKQWLAAAPDETEIARAALAKFDKKNKISITDNLMLPNEANYGNESVQGFKNLQLNRSQKLFQKRARFLASRGFSPDTIYKLLAKS